MALPLLIGGIQAGLGAVQGIAGFFQNRKARKELEKLQTPTYTPARSITDYFNEAKQRYNTSPYASTLYNTQMQNIGRSTASGIAGLQGRRSAIGGIASIIQNQNDAMLKAAAGAEQQRDQRFSQYGQASGMMGQEERQAFQVNKMLPYEKQYNLLASKASGGSQLMNAGLSNIAGGLSTYGQMNLYDKYLSSGTGGLQDSPYWGQSDPTGNNWYGKDRDIQASTYKVPRARTY